MLSLGQAQVPGLRNINQVHHHRQVDKQGRVRVIKKNIAGVLEYLRWNEEKRKNFQSIWEMEDGTVLVFFSNVIQDIQSYVNNWMTCPTANIYWFLIKKGCDEEDVSNMLKKCFSPEDLVKIGKVSYNGPMAVLKETFHLDNTNMVKNSRQFDMDRGLSKEEKLSRAQQAAASQIQYGVVTHGALGAFNFEDDSDDFKTVTKNKEGGPQSHKLCQWKRFR